MCASALRTACGEVWTEDSRTWNRRNPIEFGRGSEAGSARVVRRSEPRSRADGAIIGQDPDPSKPAPERAPLLIARDRSRQPRDPLNGYDLGDHRGWSAS